MVDEWVEHWVAKMDESLVEPLVGRLADQLVGRLAAEWVVMSVELKVAM